MEERAPLLAISETEGGLALSGEIDASSSPMLAARLDPLPPGNGDLVVDLAEISFIDSSGLRVLIEAHQRAAEARRRLVLRAPSPSARRLFEISGLGDYFHIAGETST